jgi:exosome complex component RRP42
VDDLSADYTTLLHSTLAHPSLRPANLDVLPGRKAWACRLDAVVQADGGNVSDALWAAACAALWDTRVPRTRAVEYRRAEDVEGGRGEGMDVDKAVSGFDAIAGRVRGGMRAAAVDFELLDYWDEGDVLGGRDAWPVGVTLNVVRVGRYYLDYRAFQCNS